MVTEEVERLGDDSLQRTIEMSGGKFEFEKALPIEAHRNARPGARRAGRRRCSGDRREGDRDIDRVNPP